MTVPTSLSALRRAHRQHVMERAMLRAASSPTTPSARQELLVLESLSRRSS